MDRAQVWKITADFSSLSRNAGTAARKIRELDKARTDANANADLSVASDKEAKQLNNLADALTKATAARRAANDSMQRAAAAQEKSTRATERATVAHKSHTKSLKNQAKAALESSSAHSALSSSVDGAAASMAKNTNAVSKNTKAVKNNRSQMAQARRGISELSSGMGILSRAFTDILPVSRSWSLIMKMLPLTAVTSAVNSLSPAIAGLGGALGGLMGSLGPVVNLLGSLPTLLFAAGGAAGGVVAGITGVAGAMKAYTEMQKAQEKATRKGTKTDDKAEKARLKREKALQKSLRNAERDQKRNAEAIADANQKLADTIQDNYFSILEAEQAVKDAQQGLKDAQENINKARKDAIKILDDYKDKVKESFLAEEDAALSLESARAALARTILDSGATDYEKRAADLAVRQAEERLGDVQKANGELAKEADAAAKKGVDGSDALRDAKKDEEEAARRLERAEYDLIKTRTDANRSLRDANRSIEDANQTYADGVDKIAELKQELADLGSEADDSAGSLDAAAEKAKAYEEALAKLSKEGRGVVTELIKLKDAWTEVSKAAEAAMSPGLLSFLKTLNDTIFPGISGFLVRMARGAGDFAASLGGLLGSSDGMRMLNSMMSDAVDVMGDLGEATLNLIDWMLGLGEAAQASGLTKWISSTIKQWTKGWRDATRTPAGLKKTVASMEDGVDAAKRWGRAIRDTWRFLGKFFKGFKPLGDWVLDNISETTKAWNEWAESPSGQAQFRTWNSLAKINLSGLAGAIGTIVDQGPKMFDGIDFDKVWKTINNIIESIGDLIGMVTEEMLVAVLDMGSSVAGVLESIGKGGAMDAVITVVSIFGDLAGFVDGLIETIPVLGKAIALALGVFASKKMLVGLGALTGVTPVLEAMTKASAKGYSWGDGLGGAAAKEYMGYGNFNKDRTTSAGATIYNSNQQGKNAKRTGADKATIAAVKKMTPDEYDNWVWSGAAPIGDPEADLAAKQKKKSGKYMTGAEYQAFAYGPDAAKLQAAEKNSGALSKGMNGLAKAGKGVAGVFKGVGTAIYGALGPIGLVLAAVTVATTAISYLDTKAEKSSKSVEDMGNILKRTASNASAWDDVFSGWSDGSLGSFMGKQVDGVKTMEDAVIRYAEASKVITDKPWWHRANMNNSTARAEARILGEEFKKLDEAAQNLDFSTASRSTADLTKQMQEAGWTAKDIEEVLPNSAKNARTALQDLNKGTEVTSEAVASLLSGDIPKGIVATTEGFMAVEQAISQSAEIIGGPLTDELYRLKDGSIVAGNSQKAMADKMDRATDTITEQKNKLSDWNEEVNKALRSTRNLAEARDGLQSLVNDITSALTEDDFNGTLTGTSDAAIENRDRFRSMADGINEVAQKMIDAKVPMSEVNDYLREQREYLIETASKYDKVAASASGFTTEMGIMPDRVETEILVSTPNLNAEEIGIIEERIANLPESRKSDVRVIAQSEGFEEALALLDSFPPSITIPFRLGESPKDQPKTWKGVASSLTKKRATGGAVFGPGTSTSDSIPALLSDGEYVVKASSVRSIGMGALHAMNRTGKIPGYAKGGSVSSKFSVPATTPLPSTSSAVTVITNIFNQIHSLEGYLTGTANFLNTWGSNLGVWWTSLWDGMSGKLNTAIANMGKTMNTSWKTVWSVAQGTAIAGMIGTNLAVGSQMSALVRTVSNAAPAMSKAWTTVMDTMKTPVKNAVTFLNNTLGAVVTKVSSHYGVNNSPFPVKVPGFSTGGWTGPGSKYTPAGVVHADEFVIRKDSRRAIEAKAPGLLDYMNQTGSAPGYATGGRVKPVGNAPESGNYSGHSGIDYRVASGTPVRAADGGTILSTPRLNRSYGWHIIQRLAGGLRAVYGHLSSILTTPGASVKRGEVIGRSGNTGRSSGPHLHFEVAPGSTGATSNRAYTRAWLGGAAVDPNLVESSASYAAAAVDTAFGAEAIAGIQKKVSEFAQSNNTPWGKAISAVVGSVTNSVTSSLNGSDGPIPVLGTATGDATKVSFRGGVFSNRFASALQAAEKMAGTVFRISQGGFRPRTSYSGTSHQGDAVDISSPVSKKVVNALRANGIAAWDRTGKGKWGPHIHGVPLPGFGYGAGSAPWQAKEYLAGRDGIGRKSPNYGNKRFATGGWTGPGSKYTPAGIVHADEYVINKDSRRSIETRAPGLLDHMNSTGNIPGYATGGKVRPFTVPRTLKGLNVYTSYLRKAEEWDSKNPNKRLAEVVPHVQMIEQLLAHEGGLLWRKDANGVWNAKDIAAWKGWQKRNGFTENGKLDDTSVIALLKKYGIGYNTALPYVAGIKQPTHLDVMQSQINAKNKNDAELKKYMDKFKALGLGSLAEFFKDLGANGIPEEFRDSTNPLNGLQLAKKFASDTGAARKYNEALKQAEKYTGQTDALTSKLQEMLELITNGPNGPYGLQGLARELGISLDTTSVLYRKLVANGSIKNVPANRVNRLSGEVTNFDKLFKFAKGGIVPGRGNEDSVLAWLTPGELVVPKDVVRGLFSPSAPRTSYSDFSTVSAGRTRTDQDVAPRVNNFNTTINNPVAEESSTSIQKRAKDLAALGLL